MAHADDDQTLIADQDDSTPIVSDTNDEAITPTFGFNIGDIKLAGEEEQEAVVDLGEYTDVEQAGVDMTTGKKKVKTLDESDTSAARGGTYRDEALEQARETPSGDGWAPEYE